MNRPLILFAAGLVVLLAACSDDTTNPETRRPTDVDDVAEDGAFIPGAAALIGAWDPDDNIKEPFDFDVGYNDIGDGSLDRLSDFLDSSTATHDTVLITWEPWLWTPEQSEPVALAEIIDGSYEEVIISWAQIIDSQGDLEVLLRPAPRMDVMGVYPWSGGEAEEYQEYWRHIVDVFREEEVENVKWVWSPGGAADSLDYYPGDEYVDMVGLIVNVAAAWEEPGADGGFRPFATIVKPLIDQFSSLQKPFVAAEVAIDLETEEQEREWMLAMLDTLRDDSAGIEMLAYVNDDYPGDDLAIDWHLLPGPQRLFEEALRETSAVAG
ncbi:MAG: glycosyl hydrolase [Dehalococcoidia bacterium]